MKIAAGIVGAAAGPRVQEVDARWLMAYAAALGDMAPEYLDTTRPGGIIGHPLFSVCYEWPLALDLRAQTIPDDVAVRGVHATHDLRLHRRPRPGDRLSTTATVISAEQRTPGTYVVSRFETVDADGRPVSTTDYGSIYRGVDREARTPPDRSSDPEGPSTLSPRRAGHDDGREGPGSAPDWQASLAIAPALAHVYTECARIWNPIHTDKAVAHAAGLPDIILHGTATLALAVSLILREEGLNAAAPVTAIRCRFSGMVPLPGAIDVAGWRSSPNGADRAIAFRVLTSDGRVAVRDGRLVVGGARPPVEANR